MAYLLFKTLHIVFVIAWMAAVFYLPRILVNLAETSGQSEVQTRLLLMGRRLYRFGHVMFGIAFVLGLVLWLGYRVLPNFPTMVAVGSHWLHLKLLLVVMLFVFYIVTGRKLKTWSSARSQPSATALRWFNELPLPLLVMIVWLVLAKPF